MRDLCQILSPSTLFLLATGIIVASAMYGAYFAWKLWYQRCPAVSSESANRLSRRTSATASEPRFSTQTHAPTILVSSSSFTESAKSLPLNRDRTSLPSLDTATTVSTSDSNYDIIPKCDDAGYARRHRPSTPKSADGVPGHTPLIRTASNTLSNTIDGIGSWINTSSSSDDDVDGNLGGDVLLQAAFHRANVPTDKVLDMSTGNKSDNPFEDLGINPPPDSVADDDFNDQHDMGDHFTATLMRRRSLAQEEWSHYKMSQELREIHPIVCESVYHSPLDTPTDPDTMPWSGNTSRSSSGSEYFSAMGSLEDID